MFDVMFIFVLALLMSCIVTGVFAACCGEDHLLTYIVAGCSFGGSMIILIVGIVLLFI